MVEQCINGVATLSIITPPLALGNEQLGIAREYPNQFRWRWWPAAMMKKVHLQRTFLQNLQRYLRASSFFADISRDKDEIDV